MELENAFCLELQEFKMEPGIRAQLLRKIEIDVQIIQIHLCAGTLLAALLCALLKIIRSGVSCNVRVIIHEIIQSDAVQFRQGSERFQIRSSGSTFIIGIGLPLNIQIFCNVFLRVMIQLTVFYQL